MKQTLNYNDDLINAYQDADLLANKAIFAEAGEIWYQNWQKQGAEDIGTCCGGKAIRVPYLGKGQRNYEMKEVVYCGFVQGNVAAERAVGLALEFLAANNIQAEYYDGWMD